MSRRDRILFLFFRGRVGAVVAAVVGAAGAVIVAVLEATGAVAVVAVVAAVTRAVTATDGRSRTGARVAVFSRTRLSRFV